MSSNSGWLVCEHSGGSKVRVGVEEGKSGQAPKNDTYRPRVRVCVLARVRHDPSVLLTCKGEGMKEGGEREDEGRVARQRAFLIGARGKLPPLIDREGQRLADSSRVLSLSHSHTHTGLHHQSSTSTCASRMCEPPLYGKCVPPCLTLSLSPSSHFTISCRRFLTNSSWKKDKISSNHDLKINTQLRNILRFQLPQRGNVLRFEVD